LVYEDDEYDDDDEVELRQSPPSQSHAVLLHARSQNLSPIQLEEQPSEHCGTGHDRYTF